MNDTKQIPYKLIGTLPPSHSRPTEEELSAFHSYIARFSWWNARTYEHFAPHEYILNFPCWKMKEDGKCPIENPLATKPIDTAICEKCKSDRAEFEKWVLFIRKYGERQKMLRTVYTVLCVDDKQYWTMGDPLETTWVLNRSLIDDPRRVPKLEWLDRILCTDG